jgi:hypothetical protein
VANTFTLQTSKYDGRYMKLTCSQTTDIAKNTSTISWKLESIGGSVNYYTTGPTTLTINGQQAYYLARSNAHSFPCAKGSTSGTITVAHNTYGSKAIAVSLSTAIYYKSVSTVSDTWQLDNIPRKATITAASNFNDEENPTITFSNPAGDAVSKLEVCISLDGTKDDIAYREVDKTDTSYAFMLTDAERTLLRQSITSGSSRTVSFHIRTTIGTNVDWHSVDKTLTLINHEPLIEVDIRDSNPDTVALTGNSSKFIKGYSTAQFTITAEGRKGATITKYLCNGDECNATDALLNVDGAIHILGAQDSRGNTSGQTVLLDMLDYPNVSCSQKVKIELDGETEAKITVSVEGNYFNGSFGNTANELFINVRYKPVGGDWGRWIPLTEANTPTYSGNRYSLTATLPVVFNYSTAYVIECKANDKLTEAYSGEYTASLYPIFDWSDTDFNFNVPICFKGQEMKDFVVEQGTSGIWDYRLWNSGIAECWGDTTPAAHSITTAWGAIYTKDNAIPRQYYPFQFVSDPVVSMTLHNPTGNCWAFTGTPGGVSQSPAFGLARGTSGSVTVGARIMAIGRWK